MRRVITTSCTKRFSRPALLLATLLLLGQTAIAQLSGSYTIGGAGASYATIDQAITALGAGISGPVTFLIRSGTYTSSSSGWKLVAVNGMSAINTVTFRPDAGATVLLEGNTATGIPNTYSTNAVFVIDGGKYYIFDGSNTAGGTTRNMTIRQLERTINQFTYNPAIWLRNDADNNIIRNCIVQSSSQERSGTYGQGTIFIGGSTGTSGNDSNLIRNNLVGDPNGLYRAASGVAVVGQSATVPNRGNVIHGNDIVNPRVYGVVTFASTGLVIRRNEIRMTTPGQATGGGAYGIFVREDAGTASATIDSNRIYRIMIPQQGVAYGISHAASGTAGGTVQIANNMISLNEAGYIGQHSNHFGISITTTLATTYNIHYNSIYAEGKVAGYFGSGGVTYMLHRSSATPTINHYNNVYHSTRSGGTLPSYALYLAGAGNFNSNNNVISVYADGVNYQTAFYNGVSYTTLAQYRTTGMDGASVGSNPQFVDPANGDLHISTTRPTPVESRGIAVAGIISDYDGQTRSATPDIGADEGNFIASLSTDAAVTMMINPRGGTVVLAGGSFTPDGMIENAGTTSQTIPVRLRIRNSTGTIVYEDLQSYTVDALSSQRALFGSTGNISGSTALAAGTYSVELTTELAGDGRAANNTISSTLIVRDPLNGIYTIDRIGTGARNYPSFTAAAGDLNTLGISGPVTFMIASGSYDSTAERFPIMIGSVRGSGPASPVVFKPAPGAQVSMGDYAIGPILDLVDVDYLTLDGSNRVGGRSRDWKIYSANVQNATIRVGGGAQYNTLRSLYVLTGSTNTPSGIQLTFLNGATSSTLGNRIVDNTIGDSTGFLRGSAGISMGGNITYPTVGTVIDSNDIINMGTTFNNFGAGINMASGNERTSIRYNNIRQSVATDHAFVNSYGIQINSTAGGNDTIAYNRFWNLSNGNPTVENVSAVNAIQWTGSLVVHNNMISIHTTRPAASTGANGIRVFANAPATARLIAEHNSISITGSGIDSLGVISAAIGSSGPSTVIARNNVISIERSTTGAGRTLAFYRFNTVGTWTSDYNMVHASGPNAGVGQITTTGTLATTLPQWQALGYDPNSIAGRAPFIAPAAGDLHIDPRQVFAGEGQGMPLGYPVDVDLQARDMITPDMGADEGDFNGGGIRVLSLNNGETVMAGETIALQYSTSRIMTGGVRFEVSTDNGATWLQTGSAATTVRGVNTTNMTLPNVGTPQALLRVINARNAFELDTTDMPFRIIRKIRLLHPNNGEQLVVGDSVQIRWERIPSDRIFYPMAIELSTDAGRSWISINDNVPNFADSLFWIVPNMPTESGLIRIVSRDATRFWDTVDAAFTIVRPQLDVLSPNGGERFEMAEPIAVRWDAPISRRLRLEYSGNGGRAWEIIDSSLPGGTASHTFTPPAVPTKLALVRLIDVDREWIADSSDRVFEIMPAPSLVLFTPVQGDRLMRGSTHMIGWEAIRVDRIDIQYSSNGGTTWTTIASNLDARLGQYLWQLPNAVVERARIQLVERGGPITVESGIFSIIEATPVIHVVRPNGGESYTTEAPVAIVWTAAVVNTVTLSYSSDGGATWQQIATGVSASQGTFAWTAPSAPGDRYRVRIDAGNGILDISDSNFTVVRRPAPSLTLITPNGGERYSVGSTVAIRWQSQDMSGSVTAEYSIDAGGSWKPIGTAPTGAGTLAWLIPDDTSSRALVRLTGTGGADTSSAFFTIARPIVPMVRVTSQSDAGEVWEEGDSVTIVWSALAVASIDITLSTDGGATWTRTIAQNVPAGSGTYRWRVPHLADTAMSTLMVSIAASGTPSVADTSDAMFRYEPRSSGFDDAVTGVPGLRLSGNFPNPFGGSTEIRWSQPTTAQVEIIIFTQRGTLAGRFPLGVRSAGVQRQMIDASALSAGTYHYELRVGDRIARGVMTLVK